MTDVTERHAPPALLHLAATLSLANERLFLAITLLSIAPLWLGSYLPLVDLPQHAGQIVALQQLWSGDDAFADVFRVNWFTPYLLGYLLLYVLALVMPITVASQLLVSASVMAIPLLTGRLLSVAGADERWKWLAIPCSFGFAFYWGFLSFIVAAPLCLLFLIRTIRFVRRPTLKGGAGIALFSVFLFFSHIIVLGFASLVALGYVWGASYRNLKTLVVRSLPYAAPIPIIAVWFAVTYSNEARVQNDSVSFGPLLYRLTQLFVQPAGREDLALSFVTVFVVTGAVLLLPRLSGARLSGRPERWLPFALGLAVFLGAPHYVFNAAYFYQRLGVFLVPLWLMAWDPPQRERRLDWLAMAVVVFWAATTIGRFAAFARETESFRQVVTGLEPGRRVAAMVYENGSPLFGLPVYLHFPVWYQATHGGVVDFNFAEFYSQMVRYRGDAGPRISETVAWYPTAFQWDVNGGARYHYFIVKASHDVSNEIFKEKRAAVELVANSGWWWVYRNLEARGDEAAEQAGRKGG